MTRPLRVLVGCERFGKVRDAFRRRGHHAWSNDLAVDEKGKPIIPGGEFPEFHLVGDVLHFLDGSPDGGPWDIGIFFPPCTFLAKSGVQHLYEGRKKENPINRERWLKMEEGAAFFKLLGEAPIERIARENPRMHNHALALIDGPPQQIIHPHDHGHGEKKATLLWLKKLPPLFASAMVTGRNDSIHAMSDTAERGIKRSELFDGIAEAMADQWGAFASARIKE